MNIFVVCMAYQYHSTCILWDLFSFNILGICCIKLYYVLYCKVISMFSIHTFIHCSFWKGDTKRNILIIWKLNYYTYDHSSGLVLDFTYAFYALLFLDQGWHQQWAWLGRCWEGWAHCSSLLCNYMSCVGSLTHEKAQP